MFLGCNTSNFYFLPSDFLRFAFHFNFVAWTAYALIHWHIIMHILQCAGMMCVFMSIENQKTNASNADVCMHLVICELVGHRMMENKTTTTTKTTQKQLLVINEIGNGRCLNLCIRLVYLLHCILVLCMTVCLCSGEWYQMKRGNFIENPSKILWPTYCINKQKFASTEDVHNKIIMISCIEF